jgi:dUTP pyrophosphatase
MLFFNMETLKIKCLNNNATNYYKENSVQIERKDSGYDLYYCGPTIMIPPFSDKGTKLGMGIACCPTKEHGYEMYACSRISKTPLILANHVGIIDYGYRGELLASVKNFSQEPYEVKTGDILFQVCMPDKRPFHVILVSELEDSIRGINGFGSTEVNSIDIVSQARF